MSLQKNVYSPGQWYPYFYMPPKSPEMSLYYKLVEAKLSRLYSVLQKDQIHGRILDFLGVPTAGGKIHKSKLHKIFLFETSAKGKKLLAQQDNRVKEVKLYPPKTVKPYEGPFKFFKSKNARKLTAASRSSGCESVKKTGLKEPHASAPPDGVTSRSDDESDIIRYVPPCPKKVVTLGESLKQDPKKSAKPYEGSYKFFKSKNSRISKGTVAVDVQASSSSGKPAVKKDRVKPPIEVISDSSDDSDVQFIPHNPKTTKGTASKSSKQDPKRPRDNSQTKMKVVRNRPRTSSTFWYENAVSSESSKSYSVESDEDFAVTLISSKNKDECSVDQNDPVEIPGAGDNNSHVTKMTEKPDAASLGDGKSTKPKTYDILSSVDSDDDVDLMIVTKPVIVAGKPPASSLPSASDKHPSASGKNELDQVPSTLGTESHGKDGQCGLPNDNAMDTDSAENSKPQFEPSKLPLPDENTQKNVFEFHRLNPNRKTVEFKNVKYYYYNKDSSSSLTQPSNSSHRLGETKGDELENDSSDDNDYDTGFVSPVMMSQESQLMSQDAMNRNTSGDSRPPNVKPSSWVFEKVRPKFPSSTVRLPSPVQPENSDFIKESPRNSPSVNRNRSLVLPNVQQLRSPGLSQQLSSASPQAIGDPGVFPPDLELIRRIGSLRPVEEESLSQISAATEIISARIMVDLRNPGAFEAVQQHCRSILEAVNSQNVFSTNSRNMSFAVPMLTPPIQSGNNQLVVPLGSPQQTDVDSEPTVAGDLQEIPFTVECSQDHTGAYIESSKNTKTVLQSVVAEDTTELYPNSQDIEPRNGISHDTSCMTTASQRSGMPSEALEAIADECNSINFHFDGGSNPQITPQRRKKLPFKKRRPVLSTPKLNIIAFNEPTLRAQDTSPKKSASVNVRSPLAASTESNVKHSSVASVTARSPQYLDASATMQCSSVWSVNKGNSNAPTAEIFKPSSAGSAESMSTKKSTGSRNIQRSSTASLEMRRSMYQATAANEDVPDTFKATRSLSSADAPNVQGATPFDKCSSVTSVEKPCTAAGVEAASTKKAGSMAGSRNYKCSKNPAGSRNYKCSSISIESRSPVNQPNAAGTKTSSTDGTNTSRLAKVDASDIKKSSGTTGSTNFVAATNKSTKAKSDGCHQDKNSLATDAGQLPQQQHDAAKFHPKQRNISCDSHSSKGSLKEWQRQANLLWKLTLPHISEQFFNDPEMRDARAVSDDLAYRTGVTWSEPSSRVKVRDAVEESQLLLSEENPHPGKSNEVYLEETHDQGSSVMSVSPLPRPELGTLSPFNVDPDAETQLRSQPEYNMGAPARKYSSDLDSFVGMSIASCSTAERPTGPPSQVPGCPPEESAVTNQSFPAWWQREYSTPKHSFLAEESESDDSMQVILPRSQVQRDQALDTILPTGYRPFPQNLDPLAELRVAACRPEIPNDNRSDVRTRTSAVQTRLLKKPPSSENRPDEHDFFLSFARRIFCVPDEKDGEKI